jgi:hypothetical protein
MNRQNLGIIAVFVILGVLVAARAFIGDGMGRVYTKRETVSMVQVERPVLDPTLVAADDKGTTTDWVPADSADARDFATDSSATVSWQGVTRVTPGEAFASFDSGTESGIGLDWPRTIGLWVAAFFTLAIFSFLYKDNPFYKVAESVVVGVSAAYWMVVGFWDMIVPNLLGKLTPGFVRATFLPGLDATSPQWAYLIPAAFGVLLLTRLLPKGQWLSLWTLAFIVGTTAALRMVAYIEGDFLSQVNATVQPVYQVVTNADGGVDGYATFWASVRQLTLLIGVLACLTYFFFSVEHKGAIGGVARVGIWFLMITFGAAFGFTVMGRIALLAARFEFLFDDWFWLIDPTNQRVVATAVGLLG